MIVAYDKRINGVNKMKKLTVFGVVAALGLGLSVMASQEKEPAKEAKPVVSEKVAEKEKACAYMMREAREAYNGRIPQAEMIRLQKLRQKGLCKASVSGGL
jgi:hypothetical protein